MTQIQELQEALRDVLISSFFYLELRLRPVGTLNLSESSCRSCAPEIAGAVPTKSSLQVLESEVRASKNAGDCPYLVERRCPYAGTGQWLAFTTLESDQGFSLRVTL
jgi:hypothetical protein